MRYILRFFVLCTLVFLVSCSTQTIDATGRWEENPSTDTNDAFVIMNLVQTGTTISGRVFAGAAGANVRGEARGNRFTLTSIDSREPDSTVVVDAQINGNTMTGSASYTLFAPSKIDFVLQRTQ